MLPRRTIDRKPAVDLIAAFDLACRRAGLTHDQVAGLLGMKEQQLHQQLRLQGHFSLTRLVRLRDDVDGRKFLREYWPLVAADMGISEVADKLAIADAFTVFIDALQKRMAHAELRTTIAPKTEVA